MSRIFYEVEEAAGALGIPVSEIEEMIDLRELDLVKVGSRRLVHARDVEGISARVERGGPLRTRRAFRGGMVPEAVSRAAAVLGIPEHKLRYEVIEQAQLRMPGIEGRPARIAVELPEEIAARYGAPGAAAPPREDPPESPAPAPEETIGAFYAPEQVARLLGRRLAEVETWLQRRELPSVRINDYLWVPEAAVAERLAEDPPAASTPAPRPFRLVVPAERTPEEAEVLRLAEAEDPGALRRRISALEALVRELRGEAPDDAPGLHPTDPQGEHHERADALPGA